MHCLLNDSFHSNPLVVSMITTLPLQEKIVKSQHRNCVFITYVTMTTTTSPLQSSISRFVHLIHWDLVQQAILQEFNVSTFASIMKWIGFIIISFGFVQEIGGDKSLFTSAPGFPPFRISCPIKDVKQITFFKRQLLWQRRQNWRGRIWLCEAWEPLEASLEVVPEGSFFKLFLSRRTRYDND